MNNRKTKINMKRRLVLTTALLLAVITLFTSLTYALPNGWSNSGGKTYYSTNGTTYVKGWKKIDGKKYFFDNSGAMVTGWFDYNGATYYFGSNGVLRTGFFKIKSRLYMAGVRGKLRKYVGFKWINQKLYYFNKDHTIYRGFLTVNNKTYFFKANGEAKTGYILFNEKRYYFNTEGTLENYISYENGKLYMYNANSKKIKGNGLKTVNGLICFFNSDNSLYNSGWKKYNSNKYYFTKQGFAKVGWFKRKNKSYYFGDNGTAYIGLCTIGEYEYYFNSAGVMQTKWHDVNGTNMFFQANGIRQTSWTLSETGGETTMKNGKNFKYSKVMTGLCTAYTANDGATTSTGALAKKGNIAVDPDVIPYGTKMYICSPDGSVVYGKAVAADTGSNMLNGNVLADLYFKKLSKCYEFGARDMVIYIQ